MSADFEDWTSGVEIVTGGAVGEDFPDWTEAVEVAGGSAGGYASLTGPGQTTTPGELTQEGGLKVFDNLGDGIVMSSLGQVFIAASTGNVLVVENIGTGGVQIYSSGGGPIDILADTSSGKVTVEANKTGGGNIVNLQAVGSGSAIGIAAGANAGFLTPTANRVQIAARDFLDLNYGANSGQPKGGRGIHVADSAVSGASILLTVNAGNPNGVFSGTSNGDLCVDTSTPGLWQWHSGTSSWVAF
jgi:hypothetical protein